MVVGNDRTRLDISLPDVTTVLLLLRGAENGSKAREVHDFIETTRAKQSRHYDPWQHQILVTDDGNVTAAEKQDWFNDASDCYAVLRSRSPGSPGQAVWRGPITDLLFSEGDPDYVQIRRA